jgi:2-phospho-L-lactate guanylyltransferase
MSSSKPVPFVVLPVRGIATGKSRLAPALCETARGDFNGWLLVHTLAALHAWRGSLDACIVVSACERVAQIALARGADVLREDEVAGLNAAATLGARRAADRGAASVLVLACDLPLLDAQALEALARDAQGADVVIGPDEGGTGTNALIVPSGAPFEFCFGLDSYTRHSSAAAALALRVVVHRSPALAFDVDTPEDYARWTSLNTESAAKPMV